MPDISSMTPKAIQDESLAADASAVPVPEWHKRELDRRVAEPSPKHTTSEELHSRLNRSDVTPGGHL
jgi:hypothetical protein